MTAILPQPEALEAEAAVLAATLLDPDGTAVLDAAELLREDHFGRPLHALLWRTFAWLRAHGRVIDPLTVRDTLLRGEQTDAADYVATLIDAVPTTANARHHAEIVRERALARRLATGARTILDAVDGPLRGEDLAARAQALILDATRDAIPNAPRAIREVAWALADERDVRAASDKHVVGVSTGWPGLDALVGGWRPGNYIVIGGRPSHGKSATALHFALAAAQAKVGVLVLTLEMSTPEMVERMLAYGSGVDSFRLRLGGHRLTDGEVTRLYRAHTALVQLPMWFDDTPARSIASIGALARRYCRQHQIGLLVVDYLQLVTPDRRSDNAVQEMRQVSQGLKALARELNVPILCPSQLSRNVEQRDGAKPKLSDLRESGAIEQDADVVLLLWWPPAPAPSTPATLHVLVAKQRNGPTGLVRVVYDKATGRMDEQANHPTEPDDG